jgi:hypothetical protein
MVDALPPDFKTLPEIELSQIREYRLGEPCIAADKDTPHRAAFVSSGGLLVAR